MKKTPLLLPLIIIHNQSKILLYQIINLGFWKYFTENYLNIQIQLSLKCLILMAISNGKANGVFTASYGHNNQEANLGITQILEMDFFFLCEQDFLKYFKRINIWKIKVDNKNSFLHYKNINKQFVAINISIRQKRKYFLTTYLQTMKSNSQIKSYQQNCCSWIFLLQKKGERINIVCSKCAFIQNSTIQSYLSEGQYILITRRVWINYQNLQYQQCLSSYGPKQVQMKLTEYIQGQLQSGIESDSQSLQNQIFQNKNIVQKIQLHPQKGYGLVQIENSDKSHFIMSIQCRDQQEYTIFLSPFKYPLNFRIKTGERITIKFIITSNFQQSFINYSLVECIQQE